MRLDKYLKVSRVIKRRTLAKEIVDIGLVTINGKIAKPSSEVNEGDIISLRLGERELTIRVGTIISSPSKDKSKEMFTIIEDKKVMIN